MDEDEQEYRFDVSVNSKVQEISENFINYSREYWPFGHIGCWDPDESQRIDGRLKVDYIGALYSDGEFKLHSLYKTLINHIMCKLFTKVSFITDKDSYFEQPALVLDPLPLEMDMLKHGYIVPFDESDVVTILTAEKVIEDNVYFSFVYLLDYKVWISIFLSIIIMAVIIDLSSNNKVTFYRGVTDLYRMLTGQTSDSAHLWIRLRKTNNNHLANYFIFQTMLYIAILSFTILTKSMSSVLLETYMNSYKLPMINSLEDIADNPGLKVDGTDLLILCENYTEQGHWEKLIERIEKKDTTLAESTREARSIRNMSTIQQILNGKLVLLDNYKNNKEKLMMFPSLPLAIGKMRYKSTVYAIFINKDATTATLITKWVKRTIESGFHIQKNLVDSLLSYLKGKVLQDMFLEKGDNLESLHLSDHEQDEFTLKLTEINRGVVLFLAIGLNLSLIILIIERAIFYYRQVYPNYDGVNMNDLAGYELAEAVKYETISDEKFVLKFIKLNTNQKNKKNIHRILKQNYEIYFT